MWMNGNVATEPKRRHSLKTLVHSLPLACLRNELPAAGLPHNFFSRVAVDDTNRKALTDRSQRHIVDQVRRTESPTPMRSTPRPVLDKNALLHLRGMYLELKAAQDLPRADIAGRLIPLPPPSKPRTLVLDLDETLIHRSQASSTCETVLTVQHSSGSYTLGLNVRPYVAQCLAEWSKNWELIVFTASQRSYADAIIDYIDPKKTIFAHRLYREHCWYVDSKAVKDLRMLEHRDLRQTVIIDNSVMSFAYQLSSGVPIRPWSGCLKDRELLKVSRLLKTLLTVEDVREELARVFDLHHFCREYRKALRKASVA